MCARLRRRPYPPESSAPNPDISATFPAGPVVADDVHCGGALWSGWIACMMTPARVAEAISADDCLSPARTNCDSQPAVVPEVYLRTAGGQR